MCTTAHIITLILPAKLAVNVDSKVLNGIVKLESHSMNPILSVKGLNFVCDSNDLALARVKLHLILRFPPLEGI